MGQVALVVQSNPPLVESLGRWASRAVTLALICFTLAASAQSPQPAAEEKIPTFGTTVVVSSGLRGNIYLLSPNSETLPHFKLKKPVGTIYTTSFNIPPRAFTEGFPGITNRFEWFAIDYQGRFWIEEAGRYRFNLTSDDGAKLYLDQKLIVDNDGLHPPTSCVADVEIAHGVHEMRLSYFQGPHDLLCLILAIARPGRPFQIFDTRNFAPLTAQSETGTKGPKVKPVQLVAGGRCGF